MKKDNKKNKKHEIQKQKIISTVGFFCILLIICVFIYFLQRNDDSDISNRNNGSIEKKLSSDYKNDLKIHMVDVGQGDSIILQLPNGQYFLIDSGPAYSAEKLISYIDSELGIKKIDYVLATHPDSDHIVAMSEIFNKYEIGYVFRPYVYYDNSYTQFNFPLNFNQGTVPIYSDYEETKSYFSFLKAVLNEGCDYEFFNYSSDLSIDINLKNSQNSLCNLDFLTPFQDVGDGLCFSNSNNYSPIIVLSFLDKKFMFCGDVDADYESNFLDNYPFTERLDVDLLKVSHHGSSSASSLSFLNAVLPEYAFISCGKNNSYLHPNQQTLDRLLNLSCFVYRTDLNGNVVATVDSNGKLDISVQKNASFEELYLAPSNTL